MNIWKTINKPSRLPVEKETRQSGDVSWVEVTQIVQVVELNQANWINIINNLAGKHINMSGSALRPLRNAFGPQLLSYKSIYQISRCKYFSNHTQIPASPCQICISTSVHSLCVCALSLNVWHLTGLRI